MMMMMKQVYTTLLLILWLNSIVITTLSKDYTGTYDTLYPQNSLLNSGSLYPLGGDLPYARVHHSLALTSSYVIVFGGYATDGNFLDDINLYDVRSQQWSGPVLKKQCCGDQVPYQQKETLGMNYPTPFQKMIKTGYEGDLPLARGEHKSIVIQSTDLMYMFGGVTKEYGYMNDLYYFDTKSLLWTKQDYNSGQIPMKRAGHAMESIPNTNSFVIFGGRAGPINGIGHVGLNDVWTYDTVSNIWSNLRYSKSSLFPTGRQHVASSFIHQELYIFGGINPSTNLTYNDLWVFHIGSEIWENLMPLNSYKYGYIAPPLYNAHLMVATTTTVNSSATDISLLIYGGIGGAGSCGDRTCKLLETTIGQVYGFKISEGTWNPGQIFSPDVTIQYSYIRGSRPRPSRLTGEGGNLELLTKYFSMEKIVHDRNRGIMYEFGGLEAIDENLILNGQSSMNFDRNVPNSQDSSSGLLYNQFINTNVWSTYLGEDLRKIIEIPTNGPWLFQDAFTQSQPQKNATYVKFDRAFRTYTINSIDMVLVNQQTL